ncbi:MAG: hypothetical protein AAB953_00110 [Patescibacteria group bacterium]
METVWESTASNRRFKMSPNLLIEASHKELQGFARILLMLYNTKRKELLSPGVFVDLSGMTAESWIPELRIRRQTAEAAAKTQGQPIPEMKKSVRVTIVEIPDSTRADAVDGRILVEADSVRADMYASVFYNCIPGRDTISGKDFTSDGGPLIGLGGAVPTRGETSHANYAQRPDR